MLSVLLVLIGGPWRSAFLSPGQLSTTHAQLDNDCGQCHTAADSGLAGILQASFRPPTATTESTNCLQCHHLGAAYGSAHSRPQAALDVLVQKAHARQQDGSSQLRASLAAAIAPKLAQSSQIACAVCHTEHRGRQVDLRRMDSTACQSCHQQTFRSLSDGHPEFSTEYPTKRRTRIAFNHSTHFSKHFKEAQWDGNCLSCHQPDSTGTQIVLDSFDTSCGSCHHHRQQIAGAGLSEPTVFVFGLPAVDLETLDERGLWLGDAPWPADASIGDEMPLSPFMRLLLSIDPLVARDLALLDETDGALLDLSDADKGVIEAAARLIWAIKLLIHDLLADDGEALAQRLTTALGSGLTDSQIADLTGDFADVSFADHQTLQHNLRRLQETWLTDLPDEAPQYLANPGLLYSGQLPTAPSPQPPATEKPATPEPEEATDDDLFGGDEDDNLLAGDDDLFGDDEDDDLLGGDDDLLGGDDDLLGDEGPGELTQVLIDPVQQEATDLRQQLEILRMDLQESGGWSLDEANFTVRYRPIGHADPFLRAWLDMTSSGATSSNPAATQALFDSLRREKAPGSCMRCHSVDAADSGRPSEFQVNWFGARSSLGDRSFTTFVHRPHFKFDQFRDCTACHPISTIDGEALQAWKHTYSGSDIHSYVASFDSIPSAQCAACHTSSGAGDSCLTCHNYHVGSFGSTDRLSLTSTGIDSAP